MATRYWVGGAGNWSSTTKWSASSGGASGASVPTSADDAIFDANSGGKFIATVDTAQSVNSITITPSTAAGVLQIALTARLTTNALTTTGTAGNKRIWFRSTTLGTAIDFSVNGAVSISDCDFRDVYVIGTSSPISGTRVSTLAGCNGITASTAKTVYWVTLAGGNWSGNNWAATSGGAANTDNFPLAQDTAIIENTGLNTSATVTWDNLIVYSGAVNMSGRTNAMTLALGTTAPFVYGNWTNGSGTTISGTGATTFSGRNTQTITSAAKSFSCPIIIDSFGGTVQLADALNIGSTALTVVNGTFNTQGYSVTAGAISSSNNNVRSINLGASAVALSSSSPLPLIGANLTFNAGTSTISLTTFGPSIASLNVTYYNVSFTNPVSGIDFTISSSNTFNNLTATPDFIAGVVSLAIGANQTINGTLTVAGASPVLRLFVRSNIIGTPYTLTVNSLSATDCDFRDIKIAGAAAGSSPTRAGDCGGNSGITFTSKTVYWNLAGAQDWSATAWATSSGGTPNINNFPLAQDTAVFDNAGSITGTISMDQQWNIGTFDTGARTTAFTMSFAAQPSIYKNLILSSSAVGTYAYSFSGNGTQSITSNGSSVLYRIAINSPNSLVTLNDALLLSDPTQGLTITTGSFDAVSYNVTTPIVASNNISSTVKMGSGTWTLTGTDTVWNNQATLYKGTANIVLSNTSTTARTFQGGNYAYNKLTIGGATGTSTTSIYGGTNFSFTELASTKTVAHSLDIFTNVTFGAWTVTGTVGNVVSLISTATLTIAGPRVSGVDYLDCQSQVVSSTSPGEFYAGANSTGGTNFILTAAPTPTTRYWVGGTGTWDETTTTKWSASSGGAGGASVPTSADAIVFDSLSNATAYTVTCTATQLRCASFTMAGPLVGNVVWTGTAPIAVHGNFTLSATGITRGYSGTITLSSASTGLTFTTNGVTLASTITVNGIGCGWSLGSALNTNTSNITVTNGSFNTANYSLTIGGFSSNNNNLRSILLGSSTVTLNANTCFDFTSYLNLTFNAGTSSINCGAGNPAITIGADSSNTDFTFYNINFNYSGANVTLNSRNIYNNITIAGRSASQGFNNIVFYANQTINGTLTVSAGTDATYRNFFRSDTIGTSRTLTCAAFSGTDVDFRDITIAGAAALVSGTRLGDCKGNSGITFATGVNKYWNLAAGGNWYDTAWATSSGGTPAVNNFPLAQDTAIFEATGLNSAATVTYGLTFNTGTINMSARTSNTMTLTLSSPVYLYGNWINGTGTSLTGFGQTHIVLGRSSQTITNAGIAFPDLITINSPGGSFTLQDALSISRNGNSIALTAGTFNSNGYSVSLSGAASTFSSSNSNTRTIAFGSNSAWTVGGDWNSSTSTNLTVTGTGTVSLTNGSSKSFAGGGISYSGIVINQGGAGTLTISGNNTFKDITNTYSATGATNITLGSTTQTVSQFTGTGTVGKVLTIQGASASSPGRLVLTGASKPNVNYLNVTNVRAYPLTDTWFAGSNSTNSGSLGWLFKSDIVISVTLETGSGADTVSATLLLSASIAEAASGVESIASGFGYNGLIDEAASGLDSLSNIGTFNITILEAASGLDEVFPIGTFQISVSETASGVESQTGLNSILTTIAEAASGADSSSTIGTFNISVSELASGLEAVYPSGTFGISVLEFTSGSDSVVSLAITNNDVAEAASGLDATSPTIEFNLSVLETASGLDSLTLKVIITTIINEAASALEALGIGGTFNIAVVETVSGKDQSSNIGTFNIAITEASTGAAVLTARLLWEPIDDQQTPNWTTIGTIQSPVWTDIPTQ
jgi:hypothetical protein